MEPQGRQVEKLWTAARMKFDALCHRLEAGEALAMSHSEVEVTLQAEGFEVLRLLFQEHLALRASRDPSPPLTRTLPPGGGERDLLARPG